MTMILFSTWTWMVACPSSGTGRSGPAVTCPSVVMNSELFDLVTPCKNRLSHQKKVSGKPKVFLKSAWFGDSKTVFHEILRVRLTELWTYFVFWPFFCRFDHVGHDQLGWEKKCWNKKSSAPKNKLLRPKKYENRSIIDEIPTKLNFGQFMKLNLMVLSQKLFNF